ncbi:MAG: permease-like cell division protein FtsX [Gracilibacteraceae bacterium]|jgi:cell division transport system permease protein|nr:permease-like cell division protein FtsX [Gracilibacteraceae bacterium]
MIYVIKQALRSLARNFWLSVASIMTMMISLAILGFALIVLDLTGNVAARIESQVQISAYVGEEGVQLDDGVIADIVRKIRAVEHVTDVNVVKPQEGLEVMAQERNKSVEDVMKDYGGVNPLPYRFVVDVSDSERVVGTAREIEGIQEVYRADYGQGVLEKILGLTKLLRWIGVLVVFVFALAAFVLITLNIRANVFSREKEIQIMRLVGASNAFIRGPFFVEGTLVGSIGAIIAVIVVGSGYSVFNQFVAREMSFLPIVTESQVLMMVLVIMLAGGVLIGASASMVSMRRFLKL